MNDPQKLLAIFYSVPAEICQIEAVEAADMPPPYHNLLVHEKHMTVTVESFHDCLVDVGVLDVHTAGEHYSRKIVLTRRSDGRVVQFGIVRLNKRLLPEEVWAAIESCQIPLGRVLIEHDVLRHVERTGLWKITPQPELAQTMQLDARQPTFGRTAILHVNGKAAIELLEIIACIDPSCPTTA